jgi:uncharacterized protein YjbI with pentapeptide repeats
MLFEIKRWITGSVLFTLECGSLKLCVEAAVEAGANLDGANLRGANLDGANLRGANLDGANLRGANLRGANLDGANLRGANLDGANLRGANLDGANLRGANLDGAKLIGKRPILQIGPLGSRCDYLVSYITDAGIKVQAGCFFGSLAEFAQKVKDTHGENEYGREYAAAIVMIDAHAAIWTPAKIEEAA